VATIGALVGFRVSDRVRVRSRVWIVWYMDAQTAVRIYTDNSPEMTHLSVWIRTDNNTNLLQEISTRILGVGADGDFPTRRIPTRRMPICWG